jgi:hypothetical protein
MQPRQGGSIGGADLGHQPNGGGFGACDGPGQSDALCLKAGELGLQGRAAQPAGDGIHESHELPLRRLQLSLQPGLRDAGLCDEAVPRPAELFRKELRQFRVHHAPGQHPHHLSLQSWPIQGFRVAAQLALGVGAGIALAIGGRESNLADAAEDLAREDVLWTPALPELALGRLRRDGCGLGGKARLGIMLVAGLVGWPPATGQLPIPNGSGPAPAAWEARITDHTLQALAPGPSQGRPKDSLPSRTGTKLGAGSGREASSYLLLNP